jgi:hypothetical protein
MSLLQRVTSIDGTDLDPFPGHNNNNNNNNSTASTTAKDQKYMYGPSSINNRSLRTVISYDILPQPEEDSFATRPTGGVTAYKVSETQRLVQVIITILSCWLASGIVFGFAALKPVLVDQGVYREFCSAEEVDLDVEVCYEQDLRCVFAF